MNIIEELKTALLEIRELNFENEDENGDRWANSDLIEQTVWLALIEIDKYEKAKNWYPDNNPNWKEHTPGDPRPCPSSTPVYFLLQCERNDGLIKSRLLQPFPAFTLEWTRLTDPDFNIVAWRPEENGDD